MYIYNAFENLSTTLPKGYYIPELMLNNGIKLQEVVPSTAEVFMICIFQNLHFKVVYSNL